MRLIRNLPNLLTLLNLFLGCLAIVFIYYDHMLIMDSGKNIFIDLGKIETASLCLFLAAIIDFFDGFVARLLKAESAIGKQLDSLADMVTFGLVPGLIMYQLIARSYYISAEAFDYPILYFTSGFFLTLMAAYRLARFNTESSSSVFTGLPSPAMAIFIASLPLVLLQDRATIHSALSNKWILLTITFIFGYLMVSKLPMLSLKLHGWKVADNKWTYILVGICLFILLIGLLFLHLTFVLIPMIILAYILVSILKNIIENGI
jgi:CDP-diacylglycerol--serine O-phosphatidyltransferase